MNASPILRVLGLLCATAIVSGCMGRSPRPAFYTLTPIAAERPANNASPLALAVGPAQLPRILDRTQIVTRASAHRLEISEFQRWGGPLDRELLRVLGENLGRLLGTDRVSVYPAAPPFPVDYRVTLEVQQFDGVPGEAVTLRSRWMILDPGADTAVSVGQFELRQPTEGRDYEALVAAHSAAVAALSRTIADALVAARGN